MSKDPYIDLAKQVINGYTKTGKVPKDLEINEELLNERAGTFVSLHKNGQLRGCIGTFLPTQDNVAEEIIQNAVSSCSKDPRFNPVKDYELDDLDYSVDVLSEPELIHSLDELDPKKYGVIVSSGFKRGLLLPDLDGVDTVEDQINIAAQKAGLGYGDTINEIMRFEVERHEE